MNIEIAKTIETACELGFQTTRDLNGQIFLMIPIEHLSPALQALTDDLARQMSRASYKDPLTTLVKMVTWLEAKNFDAVAVLAESDQSPVLSKAATAIVDDFLDQNDLRRPPMELALSSQSVDSMPPPARSHRSTRRPPPPEPSSFVKQYIEHNFCNNSVTSAEAWIGLPSTAEPFLIDEPTRIAAELDFAAERQSLALLGPTALAVLSPVHDPANAPPTEIPATAVEECRPVDSPAPPTVAGPTEIHAFLDRLADLDASSRELAKPVSAPPHNPSAFKDFVRHTLLAIHRTTHRCGGYTKKLRSIEEKFTTIMTFGVQKYEDQDKERAQRLLAMGPDIISFLDNYQPDSRRAEDILLPAVLEPAL